MSVKSKINLFKVSCTLGFVFVVIGGVFKF